MDGLKASRKIVKLFEKKIYRPKLIAITANVISDDVKIYMEVMDGYISKPVDIDALRRYGSR